MKKIAKGLTEAILFTMMIMAPFLVSCEKQFQGPTEQPTEEAISVIDSHGIEQPTASSEDKEELQPQGDTLDKGSEEELAQEENPIEDEGAEELPEEIVEEIIEEEPIIEEEIIEEETWEEEVIEEDIVMVDEEEEATGMIYMGCYEITAYEWTGNPCANGNYPSEGYTVACNSLPFGTVVYIEGIGYRTVEDRGATWHSDQWIDLYLGDVSSCYQFGRQYLDVWIVE